MSDHDPYSDFSRALWLVKPPKSTRATKSAFHGINCTHLALVRAVDCQHSRLRRW
jgi:hypothetical protein